MSGKHVHILKFNDIPKSRKRKEFKYDFSARQGKDIKIQLVEGAIEITLEMSKRYTPEETVDNTNYIFQDAIKKGLLLHLLLYSKHIEVKSFSAVIDGEETTFIDAEGKVSLPIYSLIPGKLCTPIPKEWGDTETFLTTFLSKSKSKQDSRWSSLYALLCAKSKKFEAERFIYFWMAFNGYFAYIARYIDSTLHPPKKQGEMPRPPKDSDGIKWLLRLHDLGREHVGQRTSILIAHQVIAILRKEDVESISKREDITEELENKIKAVLLDKEGRQYDTTAYGYLLCDLAYYFRCHIIHADKPLPLFCHATDNELRCIRLVNRLLEDFLDNHLPQMFDEDFLVREVEPKMEMFK